jgi:DHA3 family macrolide efflux protein-like MFS transporter
MRAGWRYVFTWPGMLVLLSMALVLNFLFGPTGALLPILVTKHFGGGALQLAGLNSAEGLGIVAGGLLLGLWGGFHRRMFTMLAGLIGLSLAYGSLGLLPSGWFWVATGAVFVGAGMQVMTNGPIQALLQTTVVPDMQGRVFSLVTALATAITPLGLLVAGPVADLLGVRSWYIVAGLVGTGLGVAGFFIPALIHLEDHPGAPGTPSAAPAVTSAPAAGPALPGETL